MIDCNDKAKVVFALAKESGFCYLWKQKTRKLLDIYVLNKLCYIRDYIRELMGFLE